MSNSIVEGHEWALWMLGAYAFLVVLFLIFRVHIQDAMRLIEDRRRMKLRPFDEHEYDPHTDHNNLGRQ